MVIDLAEAGRSQREGTGSKFSFRSTEPQDLSHKSPDGKVCWRPWFQPRGWIPLQLWLGTQGLSMERQPGALLEEGEPGTCSPNRPICTSWLFIPFSVPPVFSHKLNPLVREQQFGCRYFFDLMKTSWVVTQSHDFYLHRSEPGSTSPRQGACTLDQPHQTSPAINSLWHFDQVPGEKQLCHLNLLVSQHLEPTLLPPVQAWPVG